jgi:hypothetical protein
MDVIPIQASAVPCERVFSSAKLTTTPRRNRISGELMEALQILKFAIWHGQSLDFTEGLDWDMECKEMESLENGQRQVPEDVHSFVQNLLDSC